MAYIRQISEDEATGTLARVYEGGSARAGKVANIIKVMGLDAKAVQASMGLYVAVCKRPDVPISLSQREMLATVVSNINDCYY